MAIFEIEANGKTYEVDAPDQAAALSALGSVAKPEAPSISQTEFDQRFNPAPSPGDPQRGGALDTAMQGLSLGFSDELLGGLAGVYALARTGSMDTAKKVAGSFTEDQRARIADYRKRDPTMAGVSEFAGALPTVVLPGGAIAKGLQGGARVLGAMKAGALAGAGYGGLAGAGYADGSLRDRAVGAGTGAALGASIGAAFPVVGAGVGAATKPIRDVVAARVNPQGFAARKVLERMSVPMGQAAKRLERSPGMALMDVGGRGTQKLARTVRNSPYTAGDRLMTQGNLRAMAQGGRIKDQIGRVFADPDGYQEVKEGIIRARRNRAGPAYDAAFRSPVMFSRELESVLNTPAGKRAMASAKANAANSRQPWAQWFLNVGDDGSILDARRVPDMRALDQIKRELDDMVEATMRQPGDSPFARPMATPQSRAIKSVRDDLLDIVDKEVPAYREARRIAGETIKWDEALEVGRKALGMDARVLKSKLLTMTPDERELARVGVAEAIRKKIDDAGFTHNALLKVFNSREQIARLKPFFRTKDDWSEFRKAMFAEAKKRRSFDLLRGNSTTAEQLADLSDAGALNETVQAGAAAASRGITAGVLSAAAQGLRRLGGLTPETAEYMAKFLATRDPQKVRDIAKMLTQLESGRGNAQEARSAIRQALTRLLSSQTARQLSSLQTTSP